MRQVHKEASERELRCIRERVGCVVIKHFINLIAMSDSFGANSFIGVGVITRAITQAPYSR